jgi:putative FmdB family regulatory protein
MPIYEYECGKCGTFEATQKITDKPLSRCPTCKGKVKKLISNTSFQLKGTGWYVTDYARKEKAPKDKEKKDEKAPKDKEKKDEKAPAAETKGETKTDGKAGAESDGGKKESTEKTTPKPAASEPSTS